MEKEKRHNRCKSGSGEIYIFQIVPENKSGLKLNRGALKVWSACRLSLR